MRNLFGERGRHPYADRIEADPLARGESPKEAWKAGALGRRVTVTGVDLVFRPQPTIFLLWALGDEETRRVIEAAHEYAIARVLVWIEDEVAVIRYGKDGIHRDWPPGGLVAARFRHYEARSGMPLLHDHLLLSVKGQRLDGKWGSIHTTALHENTVAASALYSEIDHGFHADIESQTADGHARLDVRINGANGIVLGYEPQLSPQTARGMRAREGFRRRGGVQSVWNFADPEHAGIGTVPYVRTPNLSASVIRVQKNPIAVQDGNFVLEEGQCSQTARSRGARRSPTIRRTPPTPGTAGAGTASSCPPISRAPSQGKAVCPLPGSSWKLRPVSGSRSSGTATTAGSPHSSGNSTSRRTGLPWTTRSASHLYDRGTGATGALRTVRLRRYGLNRSKDVAAARSSLSPAPGKPSPPGFWLTRRVKRSRSAASAAVSPQAFQGPKGCPSTSRAAGSMRRDVSPPRCCPPSSWPMRSRQCGSSVRRTPTATRSAVPPRPAPPAAPGAEVGPGGFLMGFSDAASPCLWRRSPARCEDACRRSGRLLGSVRR
ncbi:MobF family relaxase [Streptomyces sp. NPDC000410]|uniref:MobF family relaxase n=1 Tax=Streptomyces sp. NPDC000410 TaxID=3154254 RepID=UPI003332148A